MRGPYRFCPFCACPLVDLQDGPRLRRRCPGCNWIHYRNPTVGAAVILVEKNELLLGRRRGSNWCIPCGHVEWDESIEEAARREFEEETGLVVRLERLFAVRSNFHRADHQTVGVWFRGSRLGGELQAGGDLTEVAFFPLDRLPALRYVTDSQVIDELRRDNP